MILQNHFRKAPNFGVDPELAVVTGASVQAGVIGGGWPLQVCSLPIQDCFNRKIIILVVFCEPLWLKQGMRCALLSTAFFGNRSCMQ